MTGVKRTTTHLFTIVTNNFKGYPIWFGLVSGEGYHQYKVLCVNYRVL